MSTTRGANFTKMAAGEVLTLADMILLAVTRSITLSAVFRITVYVMILLPKRQSSDS